MVGIMANQQDQVNKGKSTDNRCRFCSKTFQFQSLLIRHERKHSNEKRPKCKFCKKCFSTNSNLYAHIRRIHTGRNKPPSDPDANELANNLHMQNPLQWLPPLEDDDSPEVPNQPDSSATIDTPTPMWTNKKQADLMVIDLTSEQERFSQNKLSKTNKESGNHDTAPVLCIEKTEDLSVSPTERNIAQAQHPPGQAAGSAEASPVGRGLALPSTGVASGMDPSPNQGGHFTLYSDGKALKCNYCMFVCRRTCGRMIKHLQVHGIRSRNQCKSCGLGFLHKSELVDHQKMCSQASLAPQCTECGKTFSFRSLLRLHMRTHLSHNVHKCKRCHRAFKSPTAVRIHIQQQHHKTIGQIQGSGSLMTHKCKLCFKMFKDNKDLMHHHLQDHTVEMPYRCKYCTVDFPSAFARENHMRTFHKVRRKAVEDTDNSWEPNAVRKSSIGVLSLGTSTHAPTNSVGGTPEAIARTSPDNLDNRFMVEGPSYSRPADAPRPIRRLSGRARSVDRLPTTHAAEIATINRRSTPFRHVSEPSELTAGSPERIEDVESLDPVVYMRKELNSDVSSESRIGGGTTATPKDLQPWSVGDASDPVPPSGSEQEGDTLYQQFDEPSVTVKKEIDVEELSSDGEHREIAVTEKPLMGSGTVGHIEGELPTLLQFEATSTAVENEPLAPLEAYSVTYQQYIDQTHTSRGNDSQHVGRPMTIPSPVGSFSRRSADGTMNPESPCGATSTRRSMDYQGTMSGLHHCQYCDITFGDPIMHYLHMGWHVTGDPWKCNGCGQECIGKVDFFLHLYKAGHN